MHENHNFTKQRKQNSTGKPTTPTRQVGEQQRTTTNTHRNTTQQRHTMNAVSRFAASSPGIASSSAVSSAYTHTTTQHQSQSNTPITHITHTHKRKATRHNNNRKQTTKENDRQEHNTTVDKHTTTNDRKT